MVGGGYAEQVGENFGVAVVALEFEAYCAALQLIEGGGSGFLLNPHRKYVLVLEKGSVGVDGVNKPFY
jgi:hypothetical protein